MNLKLISDGNEPLSLQDAMTQLRLTSDDDCTALPGYITAARMLAQTLNGRVMAQSTWDLAMDYFPGTAPLSMTLMPNPYMGFWPSDAYRLMGGMPFEQGSIALLAPLVSVQSVTYKDGSGNVTAMVENTDYVVDTFKEPGLIAPMMNTCWPATSLWPSSAIHIQFTAGFDTPVAMGPWAIGTGYLANQTVTYGGATYISVVASTGVTPGTDITKWTTVLPAPVPGHIKTGMLLLISEWYVNRTPFSAIRFISEPPFSVSSLFTHDKLWRFR
jgi:hypothetical protein